MKEFEDKSHFLIARSLNDMVDDIVWFRVMNPTLEPKKVYEYARKRLCGQKCMCGKH